MTDVEKAEYETVVRELTMALEKAVGEVDRLRGELARLTEGASAYATLSDIHRNRDLPESVRLRAAIGCLPHELPKIQSIPPAIDATCEEIEPLSVVVERQRKRCDALLSLSLAERERMITGVVKRDGNGSDDDTAG